MERHLRPKYDKLSPIGPKIEYNFYKYEIDRDPKIIINFEYENFEAYVQDCRGIEPMPQMNHLSVYDIEVVPHFG